MAGSWTWPVHASLFTGEPPWVHGAHRAPFGPSTPVTGLRPSIPTVAEQLSEAGYQTLSVAGNRLLAPELGLVRGFESAAVYDDRDDLVLAQAQEWLSEESEQPLFLFVNLLGSHLPYVQADSPGYSDAVSLPLKETWMAPWIDTHPLGEEAIRLNRTAGGDATDLVMSVAQGERSLSASQFAMLRAVYQSEVWATDQRLGALLQAWDQRTNGTGMVVVTSDHGEHFGELGLLDHGHVLNGVNTRVPLVVYAPDVTPQRIGHPVSQLHVTNTLRTWAGVDSTDEGVLSWTGSEVPELAPILARSWPDPKWAQMVGGRFQAGERLVRSGDWALIAGDGGQRALFQMAEDPLMLRDVSQEHVKVVQKLESLLPLLDSKKEGESLIPPDEEINRALESLGYLD